MTASGLSITNPFASQDLPGATADSGVMKTHQRVPLNPSSARVYKSMVWSMLHSFTFPQGRANEAEIHLSPALLTTDVRQERQQNNWSLLFQALFF